MIKLKEKFQEIHMHNYTQYITNGSKIPNKYNINKIENST